MARIRTVKPEFWGHPIMARLPEHVQLMALALLNYADDEGYFLADPALVRSFARPFDEDSVKTTGALRELSNIGYLEVMESYKHGPIGCIVHFSDHQAISHPRQSKIKTYVSSKSPVKLHEASGLEGNREQGKEQGGPAPLPATLEPKIDPDNPPPGLHAIQYANWIMEGLGMPWAKLNQDAVRCSVESETKRRQLTMSSVAAGLLRIALRDRAAGITVDRFYFEDARYIAENRKVTKRADGFLPPQNVSADYVPESVKRKRELEAAKAANS